MRFRVCTSLASAITSLGFAGELGFNHFLYPSEAETRRLLLFLVDQMPKGGGEGEGAAGAGGAASFEDQVRTALQAALAVPWVPLAWRPKRRLRPERAAFLRRALRRSALAAARRAEQQAGGG